MVRWEEYTYVLVKFFWIFLQREQNSNLKIPDSERIEAARVWVVSTMVGNLTLPKNTGERLIIQRIGSKQKIQSIPASIISKTVFPVVYELGAPDIL